HKLWEFREWGTHTAEALRQCSKAVKVPLIASGGIRSGLDVAKSIRLGATLGGAAYPFIKAHHEGGKKGVIMEIDRWERSLKTAMLLTSSANLGKLREARLLG
ncbi:MAG TPA: alpha-hydroxy-acid oxidizing protein, partial [Candidatus Norongarragalinales archaeon]|nr:alpha-hydroxy-acid oxidizing protein [Candidatus Norongarragalinales archaeon]